MKEVTRIMSFAATLLEGYNGGVAGTVNISDTHGFLQEACTDFVLECFNAYQVYKTADIIGQAKVVTESVDVQAVYESVVGDFVKKLGVSVSKFISKITAWLKSVRTVAKKKIQAAKDAGLHKKINKALEGHDDDEKINGFTHLAIAYTIDEGIKATEAYVDAMNEVYYKCQEALFAITTGEAAANQQAVAKKFVMDKVKAELKKSLKCDPDAVVDKITKAFGAAEPTDTTYTVGCIKAIMAGINEQEAAVETQLKEADALTDIMKELQGKFEGVEAEDGTAIDPDVLGTMSASLVYILNLETTALQASVDHILNAIEQSRAVLSAVYTTLKGGQWTQTPATEGAEPDNLGDGDESDPPTDGDGEPVTEGKNIDAIKKYVYQCRDVVVTDLKNADKAFRSEKYADAKKQYQAAQAKLEKLYKEFVDMSDNDLKSDVLSGFGSIVSELIIGFDSFIQNAWINKTMRQTSDYLKVDNDTANGRNMTIRGIAAKLEACIKRCKKQIKVCESKLGVQEQTIFEQAAQYLV